MFLSFVLALVQLICLGQADEDPQPSLSFWAKSSEYFLALYSFVCQNIFPYSDTGFPNSLCQRLPLPGCGRFFQGNPAGQGQQPSISNQILVAILPSAYESEMKQAAKKYVDKRVIRLTTENYMEVMEVIYDYPRLICRKDDRADGFVTMTPITRTANFSFALGSSTVSQIPGLRSLATGAPGISKTIPGSMRRHVNEYHKQLKQSLPVLHISDCQTITKPDNRSHPTAYSDEVTKFSSLVDQTAYNSWS